MAGRDCGPPASLSASQAATLREAVKDLRHIGFKIEQLRASPAELIKTYQAVTRAGGLAREVPPEPQVWQVSCLRAAEQLEGAGLADAAREIREVVSRADPRRTPSDRAGIDHLLSLLEPLAGDSRPTGKDSPKKAKQGKKGKPAGKPEQKLRFTITRAADHVGVSASTIRRWIRGDGGSISAEPVQNGLFKFDKEELDRLRTTEQAKRARLKQAQEKKNSAEKPR